MIKLHDQLTGYEIGVKPYAILIVSNKSTGSTVTVASDNTSFTLDVSENVDDIEHLITIDELEQDAKWAEQEQIRHDRLRKTIQELDGDVDF